MDLSIIIPVYNQQDCLGFCLKSITEYNLQDEEHEIIVVDDGSTDRSVLIAKDFQKRHAIIKIFTQANNGAGSARNKGIKEARGNYLYFLDPDDYVLPDTLSMVLSVAKINSLDIIFFNSKSCKERILNRTTAIDNKLEMTQILDGKHYYANLSVMRSSAWWYFVRRELIIKTKNYFPEGRWLEDVTFTPRIIMSANRASHFPLDVHRHVEHSKSAMFNRNPSHLLSIIKDYQKAIADYSQLLHYIKQDVGYEICFARLTSRYASLVFFLIARCIRAPLAYKEVRIIINQLKQNGHYPIENMIGKDFHGLKYRSLLIVFNNPILLYLFFNFYKTLRVLNILRY